VLAETALHAPSWTLRGGTREILRGIIARGLGCGDRHFLTSSFPRKWESRASGSTRGPWTPAFAGATIVLFFPVSV